MQKLFENWQKYLREVDQDGDGSLSPNELRAVADDLEDSGGSFDIQELVEEHDLDYEGEPIGFFLSLVRELPVSFMSQREQDLTEEMRQAVARILTEAHANTGPKSSPEEEGWAETYRFFGKEPPPK